MDPICKISDDRVARAAQAADIDAFAETDWRLRKKMRAAVAALRKDAERYRWLREHGDNRCTEKDGYGGQTLKMGDCLDSAVDAAMSAAPAVGAA